MSVLTPNDFHRLRLPLRAAVETWLTDAGFDLNDVVEVQTDSGGSFGARSHVVTVATMNRDGLGKPVLNEYGILTVTRHPITSDAWPL